MRMRKKKHGAERIAACSELLIEDVSALKGGLDVVFPTVRPIHMEIGCGKGNFASGMAANNVQGGFRMGPIFGGMFKSGRKIAKIILEDLKA